MFYLEHDQHVSCPRRLTPSNASLVNAAVDRLRRFPHCSSSKQLQLKPSTKSPFIVQREKATDNRKFFFG